jgi:hypothetical protein
VKYERDHLVSMHHDYEMNQGRRTMSRNRSHTWVTHALFPLSSPDRLHQPNGVAFMVSDSNHAMTLLPLDLISRKEMAINVGVTTTRSPTSLAEYSGVRIPRHYYKDLRNTWAYTCILLAQAPTLLMTENPVRIREQGISKLYRGPKYPFRMLLRCRTGSGLRASK